MPRTHGPLAGFLAGVVATLLLRVALWRLRRAHATARERAESTELRAAVLARLNGVVPHNENGATPKRRAALPQS